MDGLDNVMNAGTAAETPAPAAPPVERPRSMQESFDRQSADEASDSQPAGTAPTPETPASATQTPGTEAQTASEPTGKQGEPPQERWPDILENARRKARDEALAEHQDILQFRQQYLTDPVGTLMQEWQALQAHPQFGQQAASAAARMLAALRGKQAAQADEEPQADLQTQDGLLVYSAEQLRKWHQWNARQQEAKFSEQLQPLLDERQQRQQVEAVQQLWAQSQQAMGELLDSYKTLPGFAEHKQAITERYAALSEPDPQTGLPKMAPDRALLKAYGEILATKHIPGLSAAQQQQLAASAAAKAAGRADNPAAAVPAVAKRPRSMAEAFEMHDV